MMVGSSSGPMRNHLQSPTNRCCGNQCRCSRKSVIAWYSGLRSLGDIVLYLHPLFNISPIQGSKSLQLLTPAESTVAYVAELCRDDSFLEHNTIKENFFANLRESWWYFFHEYGRRVGMVPRSSLKERKKQSDGGEKDKSNPTTNQTNQNRAHRPSLHHLVVFPLY